MYHPEYMTTWNKTMMAKVYLPTFNFFFNVVEISISIKPCLLKMLLQQLKISKKFLLTTENQSNALLIAMVF